MMTGKGIILEEVLIDKRKQPNAEGMERNLKRGATGNVNVQ